jgi:adenosylhomocysteinase
MVKKDVKSLKLAKQGKQRIEWADKDMLVLNLIRERFKKQKPLKGVKMAACLHVTAETANLMRTLKAGGAEVALCASNPLSTQDDVAASLVSDYGISVFAINAENRATYYKHLNQAVDMKPIITMDDGADLVSLLHSKRVKDTKRVVGGTEETTTGVIRLKALASEGKLLYPIVAVNDAETKHFFDNRYGTGQSTIDGIIRATDMLLAGKNVVVAGYGWCGRGFANKARGMGANVIVTEIDDVKALEAVMDGFSVMPMNKAASVGDLFVTLTGDMHVVDTAHFKKMKSGAMVCNSGHFDLEINVTGLNKIAKSKKNVKPFVDEYTLSGNKKVYVLAEGRLINLAAAEGHPASVMDMSFANQALSSEYVIKNYKKLNDEVYTVPEAIDKNIAKLKLKSMGISIDKLTPEQEKYLSSWEVGT